MDALLALAVDRQLKVADLGLADTASAEGIRSSCDNFAEILARAYLSGELPWSDADSAINHIYLFMVQHCGDRIPDLAWDIYMAFHAGEYPEPVGDPVTRPLVNEALQRMPNNRWRGP